MSTSPWSETDFCGVVDVRTRISDPAVVLQSNNNGESLDLEIQKKIDLSKGWLRRDLIGYFQSQIPTTFRQWQDFRKGQLINSLQAISRDFQILSATAGIPNAAAANMDGVVFDLFYFMQYWPAVVPQFFQGYGAPVDGINSQYAGTAYPGAFYVDTKFWVVYINRGASGSPVWQRNDVFDVVDYILNPDELRDAAVAYALWAMAKDGMFANRVGTMSDIAQWRIDVEAFWGTEAKGSDYAKPNCRLGGELGRALPLLKIDYDGDGIISSWEASLTVNEPFFFA